ncbi:DJ-1/PfpI family protein [Annulohypoxylon maeteangense]|uniref:DJ-1/PfpI family protein n=1 Tax=Annulohypoxylon maeteangense TaxID=1927788 RepID=UPI002007CF85|nr:DJ-1/PfpI family protein [Annulohypoxylon maeteangense]KAI0886615.1 DJ-1/PfpI family protein [Annulohypoxylon maeteangense]
MAPKVLVVLTSYGFIESVKQPTGWYLPEFAHPYEVLSKKGVEIVTASPKGGLAPLDPSSVEAFKADASSASFLSTQSALWEQTATISSFLGRSAEFAGLLYPGGHGPMFDLATDKDSIALINEFVAAGKPVAAVCHGPAVFVNVELPGGKKLLHGKEATGFSNAEEDVVGMSAHMPFSLEDKIAEAGATYKKAPEPWAPLTVVQDGGKFITGQNPASSVGVGEALAKAIGV